MKPQDYAQRQFFILSRLADYNAAVKALRKAANSMDLSDTSAYQQAKVDADRAYAALIKAYRS